MRVLAEIDGVWYGSSQFGTSSNDHGMMDQNKVTDWEEDSSVNTSSDLWYQASGLPSGYDWRDGSRFSTTPLTGLPVGQITRFGIGWLHQGNDDYGAVDNFRVLTQKLVFTVLENIPSGTEIATIPVTDPDGDPLTFTLGGSDESLFALDNQSGKLTIVEASMFDYETRQSFNLIVTASDGKLSVTKAVEIQVQDLPETTKEYALSFDGSDDKVSVPFSQSLQNDNITISAWVKPDELSQDLYTVVGFQEAFNLKLQKSNQDYKISVHIKTSNGDWFSDFSTTEVILGKWNHIAASYDGNSVQFYLNGVADGSFAKTGNLITSGGLSIGSRDINSEYFDGLIDDVQIWNKALSESEIQDRMYRPIDQTDPLWSDLSGYYRMDWGQGNTAYDYSANENHGTLTNGPEWVEAYSWERGMVAHYPLDGSGRDIHGTHSGSLIGTTPTTNLHGYSQKALRLDGVDDYVEIS